MAQVIGYTSHSSLYGYMDAWVASRGVGYTDIGWSVSIHFNNLYYSGIYVDVSVFDQNYTSDRLSVNQSGDNSVTLYSGTTRITNHGEGYVGFSFNIRFAQGNLSYKGYSISNIRGEATGNSRLYVEAPISPTPTYAATNNYGGKICTTNCSAGKEGGIIKESKDAQVWADFWGAKDGSPESNQISRYDLYVNNVDSPNSAEKFYDGYTKNLKQNISLIMTNHNVAVGGRCYFWIETVTKSGTELGKIYLGAIDVVNTVNPVAPTITTASDKVSPDKRFTVQVTKQGDAGIYNALNYDVQTRIKINNAYDSWYTVSSLDSNYDGTIPIGSSSFSLCTEDLYGSDAYKATEIQVRIGMSTTKDSNRVYSSAVTRTLKEIDTNSRDLFYKNSSGVWNPCTNSKMKDSSGYEINVLFKNK